MVYRWCIGKDYPGPGAPPRYTTQVPPAGMTRLSFLDYSLPPAGMTRLSFLDYPPLRGYDQAVLPGLFFSRARSKPGCPSSIFARA